MPEIGYILDIQERERRWFIAIVFFLFREYIMNLTVIRIEYPSEYTVQFGRGCIIRWLDSVFSAHQFGSNQYFEYRHTEYVNPFDSILVYLG